MQRSDVMEARIDVVLECAKEKQPIVGLFFIEVIAYFRKRIAYLEAMNKEQAGYINMHQSINSNPHISAGQIVDEPKKADMRQTKKFWKI